MSKIIYLSVSNLLRIRAVEVRPDNSFIIVAGENDQGKSSLLNAIALALSGKDLPAQPIRQGASKGQVILQTEDLTVTRTFSQTGGSTLEVRDASGKITSPQAKLDALVSRVTFDPFEFTRMKPADQLNTIRKIVGLDFTALDSEHAAKYAERTGINRQIRDQEGVLGNIQRDGTAPAEEVSIAELTRELEEANALNAQNKEQRLELSAALDVVELAQEAVSMANREIVRLERELESAKHNLQAASEHLSAKIIVRDNIKAETDKLHDADTAAILAKMRDAESINAKVRWNNKWNEEHRKLLSLQTSSGALTTRLAEISKSKEEALAAAKFPVPGLGFNDAGVTFNGLPFEQAGTAVKIRASVAIARALNPGLPVMLIRDGSLLDDKSEALLREEADTHGCQIWIEMVGNREDATLVLEDGAVIARPAEEAKKKKGGK